MLASNTNDHDSDFDDVDNIVRMGPDFVVPYIDDVVAQDNPVAFGGPSTYNLEQRCYTDSGPHLDLLEDLSVIIPDTFKEARFQLEWHKKDTAQWKKLISDIMESQKEFEASKSGYWQQMWYGLGDAEASMEPWLALIPDDFGLSVVKASVALLFRFAGKSKDAKERIVRTFTGLREALENSDPTQIVFGSDPEVHKHADKLYHAIVVSVRELLQVTAKPQTRQRIRDRCSRAKTSILGGHYVPRPPPVPSRKPEQILQDVTVLAADFQRAVGQARDGAIQRTDRTVQNTSNDVRTVVKSTQDVKRNTEDIMTNLDGLGDKSDSQLDLIREQRQEITALRREAKQFAQELSRVASELARQQRDDKNNMLSILLDQFNAIQRVNGDGRSPLAISSTTLLSRQEFASLLAGRRTVGEFAAQVNVELSKALKNRSGVRLRDFGQANSTLQNAGFKAWLAHPGSVLTLVNANLTGELERMSAMSVFAATLVASLVAARPSAVVVHFFCGLHNIPSDPEFGPNGLLRSVMMQLVLKLVELERLDLRFTGNQQKMDSLMSSDPETVCRGLCWTLSRLVDLFPATAEVYCVLDSITWFCRDKTFHLLDILMERLQMLVDDTHGPIIKILLTNNGHAPPRLRNMPVFDRHPERLITLPPANSAPFELSSGAISRQISSG